MAFGLDDLVGLAKNPGVITGAISAAGGLLGNLLSSDSAQSAQDFSAQQYATRYQTTVKDLEAAGLSPMLAYSQGAGSPPTGVSYQAQNPFSGVPSAYAGAANLDVTRSQISSSAEQNKALTDVATANAKKITAEIENIPLEANRLKAMAESLYEQAALSMQKGTSEVKAREQMEATIRKLKSDTELLNLDISAAKTLQNIGRGTKELKPVIDLILSVVKLSK